MLPGQTAPRSGFWVCLEIVEAVPLWSSSKGWPSSARWYRLEANRSIRGQKNIPHSQSAIRQVYVPRSYERHLATDVDGLVFTSLV